MSRAQKKDSRRCPFVLVDNHASYRLIYTGLKMITSRKLFEEVNRRFSRTRSRSVTICSMNCRWMSNHFLHRQFNVLFIYFNNAPFFVLLLRMIYFSAFLFWALFCSHQLIYAHFIVYFVKKQAFLFTFLAISKFSSYFCRVNQLELKFNNLNIIAYSYNTTLNEKID